MLTSIAVSLETAKENDKQIERLNAIATQAQRTSEAFRQYRSTFSGDEGLVWTDESSKLALLIDPSRPIPIKQMPTMRNFKVK